MEDSQGDYILSEAEQKDRISEIEEFEKLRVDLIEKVESISSRLSSKRSL